MQNLKPLLLATSTVALPVWAAEPLPTPEELWRIVQKQQQEIQELKARLAAKEPSEAKAPTTEETGEVEELKRKASILAQELDRLRTQLVIPEEPKYKSMYGLGPAASKVYQVGRGLSLGGYGEGHYKVFTGDQQGSKDTADFVRLVLYTGYRFSDAILFNSELEFEHASTGKGGEVSVEFAALDFFLDPKFNLRAGMVLVPMGFLNPIHEPPFYFGNNRPEVERRIIPTTWREIGVGAFGELFPGLTYTAYGINGLRASNFSPEGIRGGRQSASQVKAEDLAWVGRLDYAVPFVPGLTIGGSAYLGNSGQGEIRGTEVFTQIYEGHLQWHYRGLEFRTLGAWSRLDDAAKLSQALKKTIGKEQYGWYIELGYDVLPWLLPDSTQYLAPFFRYERWDTQAEVAKGFEKNANLARRLWQFGVNYKPIPNVVIKADYRNFDADEGNLADEFNLGLGFIF